MEPTSTWSVGARSIGHGAPCFVIAEAGVNHNGDVALAHALIDAAAEVGVDAVKFQTFDPDLLVAADARKATYQAERTGAAESQREMLRKLALPGDAYAALLAHANDRGLIFMSTPFDPPSAELLARVGVPAFKISSGEVTNHPFLKLLARMRRPLLLSTGMSDLDEVEAAVTVLRGTGEGRIALFHCTSSYPAPIESVNLRAMDTLRDAFGVPVGYSDHSLGSEVPWAAVARGAELLEKHLTLDAQMEGPDHAASMEPAAFAAMVRGVRAIEAALGDGVKRMQPVERDVREVARRSLYTARALEVGHALTEDDVVCLRPAHGISPARLPELVGRRLRRPVAVSSCLSDEDFE